MDLLCSGKDACLGGDWFQRDGNAGEAVVGCVDSGAWHVGPGECRTHRTAGPQTQQPKRKLKQPGHIWQISGPHTTKLFVLSVSRSLS